MPSLDLSGRTALVTGASRGIGRAIAEALALHGADVALTSRSADALASVAAAVAGHGRTALTLSGDMTDPGSAAAVVESAAESFGRLDIVVANVGGSPPVGLFLDVPAAEWDEVHRLNLQSVVHVLRAAGPILLDQGAGSVVTVASVAGLSGNPGQAAYGAAKTAVVSLTRSLALEWAWAGVRVNALCPGWTVTDLTRELYENPVMSRRVVEQIPLQRWATPDEIAVAAVFLASDAASFITGHALAVDGGQLAL